MSEAITTYYDGKWVTFTADNYINVLQKRDELEAELNLLKSETAHSMVMCKCTKSYKLPSEKVCKVCKITQLEAKVKSHEANIKMRADHVAQLQADLAASKTEANDLRVALQGKD